MNNGTILRKGSVIGAVTPSWAGPEAFPKVFDLGLKLLKENFNVTTKEYANTRESKYVLSKNPQKRAEDLMLAFEDTETDMIISSIGGDDSIRILPFLNLERIKKNPKLFMGFSDSTTLLTYLNQQGIVTLHGPSIMAGFAEPVELSKEFIEHIQKFFFQSWDFFDYHNYSVWTESRMDWGEIKSYLIPKEYKKNSGWQIIQGSGNFSGKLYGGNLEIFEMMKGTPFMEDLNFLKDKILFLETSEEKPTISYVKYALRSMGVRGVFDKVSGILFGRAKNYSDDEKIKLYSVIKKVVSEEFRKDKLPIVANMDFGHTSPQWVIPLGIQATVDLDRSKFKLNESVV